MADLVFCGRDRWWHIVSVSIMLEALLKSDTRVVTQILIDDDMTVDSGIKQLQAADL